MSEHDETSEKKGASAAQRFPAQLHYVLKELASDGLGSDSIVSWNKDGRSFCIHDKDRFQSEVIPMWFRQSHYSSFIRQLSIYGFKRTGKMCYAHDLFNRDRPDLCEHILPVKKSKGKSTEARANAVKLEKAAENEVPTQPLVREHAPSPAKASASSKTTEIRGPVIDSSRGPNASDAPAAKGAHLETHQLGLDALENISFSYATQIQQVINVVGRANIHPELSNLLSSAVEEYRARLLLQRVNALSQPLLGHALLSNPLVTPPSRQTLRPIFTGIGVTEGIQYHQYLTSLQQLLMIGKHGQALSSLRGEARTAHHPLQLEAAHSILDLMSSKEARYAP